MSTEGISEAILSRLADEAALPVHTAITRFAHAAPARNSANFSLSADPPNLFSSLNTINTCYNVWIALPQPSSSQLSNLRQQLSSLPSPSPVASVEFVYASRVFCVPLLIINVWPRLQSLILIAGSWGNAQRMLESLSKSSGTSKAKTLAQHMLRRLPRLSLDSAIPGLLHFRSSYLPDLLTNSWLSDEHINAANQVIALHPQRDASIEIMDTYFLVHLKNHLERDGNLLRRRPRIANGIITGLLIPIHHASRWSLLYVDIPNRHFAYADTLDLEAHIPPPNCLESISCWLSSISGASATLLVPTPLPFHLNRQTDSHSCGVAVITNIAHYAIGIPSGFLAWSQDATTAHCINWSLLISQRIWLQDIPEQYFDSDDSMDIAPLGPSADSTDSDSEMSDPSISLPIHPSTRIKPAYKQLTLSFPSISRQEWNLTEKQRYLDRCVERENEQERIEMMKAKLKLKRQQYNRERKRKQRERKRVACAALKVHPGGPSSITDLHDAESPISDGNTCPLVDPFVHQRLASLTHARTRPGQTASGAARSKKARIRPSTATRRVNWCHPLIWPVIDQTSRQVGFPWSPTEVVRRLQRIDPILWTESHMRAIEAGDRTQATGAGRKGVFECHLQVVRSIRSCLVGLRTAGVSLNLNLIRGYMVGVIQHYIPDTFTRPHKNRPFRCSTQFVRRFLHTELGWTIRKGTRAAQKYPSNVNAVLLHAYLRFACAVRDKDIPSCCIVNADQTQVVYNPGDQKTWNSSGDWQIHILGSDDKHAFTLMVAISNSGSVLPFQAIYAGRSARSLPDPITPHALEAAQLMFSLNNSGSNNYWSSFDTLCIWVVRVLVPYFLLQRAQHKLPENQRCILQIDCWAVHRSARFRDWMKQNYPWIILLYVPGGCTGLFQACDVGIQRILKLAISRAAHADIVVETATALQAGVAADQIVNDQTLRTLRNRSVGWIVKGYHAINRPDIVKKAFALCTVPETEFNLSYESLTSRAARQAILDLRRTNPELYTEITSGRDEITSDNTVNTHEPNEDTRGEETMAEDDDVDHTVEEVTSLVLNAHTAAQAARPLEDILDHASDEEEHS
ncbi:ATP-binding cassette sub-family A member 6 [Homo sapiens] [Rhizoctonia solani]|uniref:ATP-binding cassette sub-family A member 6 [Homo sapiens] n=1 Tax=Rhizoctonia solani TaxID=456999 RepID=A0A0K6FQ82_9AGAM|nr:ATP-binding cassette sub-family A member 6 [Homo sapiens] [Rhizoctonia solani]